MILALAGGLLMIAASAVPLALVPSRTITRTLHTHRSNLAAIGMGTVAIALICLNVAVF